MDSKERVLEFLKLRHSSCAYTCPTGFDVEPNSHLLAEINEPIKSVEIQSKRLIVFYLETKCIVLCAWDDDGDQSCDSVTYFGNCNFDSVIGKVLKTSNHLNVITQHINEDKYDHTRILTHTYELIFSDGYSYELQLINESNGYYDGYLEIIVCSNTE